MERIVLKLAAQVLVVVLITTMYHIHAMNFEKSFLSFHRYFSLQDSKIKFKVKSFFGRDIMQKGLIFTHYIRRATHFSKN